MSGKLSMPVNVSLSTTNIGKLPLRPKAVTVARPNAKATGTPMAKYRHTETIKIRLALMIALSKRGAGRGVKLGVGCEATLLHITANDQ